MRAAISVGTPEKRRLSICVHSQSACTVNLRAQDKCTCSERAALPGPFLVLRSVALY
jgi:hypothetical protein